MGPGHFAIALAAKPIAPKAPLWTLLATSEALDLLSFGFIAAGVEQTGITQTSIAGGIKIVTLGSIPWSHGLFMSVVWSALAARIAYLVFHDRRASAVMASVVFSHWVLDFVVHLPDLPLLFNNSPRLTIGRKVLNWLTLLFGTDITRRFGDLTAGSQYVVVRDEPSLLRGAYRVILARKVCQED